MITLRVDAQAPGSARVWRANASPARTFGVSPKQSSGKFAIAGRNRQRARGTRSPEWCKSAFVLFVCITSVCHAAEVIPPKPDRYFNDYANVISTGAASRFNEKLAQFERETSNQIVVAIFPKMQSDSDVADYGQRLAQAWAIGTKEKRNGVALFVFVADRKISLQAGYGLEGALPDATAYDIRANQITPHFRNGDYEGGIGAGIDSIIQAIHGEYKGTGQTVAERNRKNSGAKTSTIILLVWLLIFFLMLRSARRNMRRGYRYSSFGGPYVGGWSGGSGGGWSSGGGGGGFSGFSGGGGSFGGGGSSGSW